jgi:hypothetical protein
MINGLYEMSDYSKWKRDRGLRPADSKQLETLNVNRRLNLLTRRRIIRL